MLVVIFPMVQEEAAILTGIFFTGFALYGINGILWLYALDQGGKGVCGQCCRHPQRIRVSGGLSGESSFPYSFEPFFRKHGGVPCYGSILRLYGDLRNGGLQKEHGGHPGSSGISARTEV